MSEKKINEAFSLIDEKFAPDDLDFCGHQSTLTIEKAEQALGISFPTSYKLFLEKYGCGGIHNFEIYGLIKEEDFDVNHTPTVPIPNVVWTTLAWNRDFNHPLQLPIISELGEGSVYCLDTSHMNSECECPVVIWPIGGYEDSTKLEVVATNFGEFFLKMVKNEMEKKTF